MPGLNGPNKYNTFYLNRQNKDKWIYSHEPAEEVGEAVSECAATPHDKLIAEICDSRVAKTEREHAASREIERLRAENADLQRRLDNELARGIHTCHDKCERPMCVLRRERDALAAKFAEIQAQKPECYYVGMIDGHHVVRMLDGSLVPAVGTAYYKHAGLVCGQPAVKESLTTAASAEPMCGCGDTFGDGSVCANCLCGKYVEAGAAGAEGMK